MTDKLIRNLLFAGLAGSLATQLGCASSSAADHSPAEVQAYNRQRNIEPGKVKAFLDQLAAVPMNQRRDFMNQHAEEMRSLTQSQDPADRAKFQELTRGAR